MRVLEYMDNLLIIHFHLFQPDINLIKATLVSTPPGTTFKLVGDKLGSHNITWSTRRCERLGALRLILAKNIWFQPRPGQL